MIQFNGEADSTAWLREDFPSFDDLRYDLWIAMKPIRVGVPLCEFNTKKELVGIFIDIIRGNDVYNSSCISANYFLSS